MNKENRTILTPDGEKRKEGYILSVEELSKLCRDFMADCFDGFVSLFYGYDPTK